MKCSAVKIDELQVWPVVYLEISLQYKFKYSEFETKSRDLDKLNNFHNSYKLKES